MSQYMSARMLDRMSVGGDYSRNAIMFCLLGLDMFACSDFMYTCALLSKFLQDCVWLPLVLLRRSLEWSLLADQRILKAQFLESQLLCIKKCWLGWNKSQFASKPRRAYATATSHQNARDAGGTCSQAFEQCFLHALRCVTALVC